MFLLFAIINHPNIFNSKYQDRLCQNMSQPIIFILCRVLALLGTKFANVGFCF